MSEFVASNGVKVIEREHSVSVRTPETGTVYIGNGIFGIALKEHLAHRLAQAQHERDEELGRWRWPENPEWIVYPARDGYTGECDLLVINETWGAATEYTRVEDDGSPCSASDAARAARAYFEAHPERKPWEEAAEGDIWELDGAQYLAVDDTDGEISKGVRFFSLPLLLPTHADWSPGRFPSEFEAGTRMYSKDAS